MKTKVTIWLFLLFSKIIIAQSSDVNLIQTERNIGKNFVTQKEIVAKETQFPNHIYKSYFDTISGNVTLQLRKLSKNGKTLSLKGQLVVFNLKSNTVKLSQKVDYSINNVQQFGNTIVISRGDKNTYLNNENGEELWNDFNDVFYVNNHNNIAVQYFKNKNTKLQGINFSTGNVIWQRELNREFGWNKIVKLNDSIYLIVASGTHSLNIKNGKGWDYNTITGKKDYTETILKNAAGVALGFLTGVAITSSGPNLVRDIVSNTLIDSTFIYLASKEKLSKINKYSGELKWSFALPEDLTSKSLIYTNDSLIFMINQGYANYGNRQIDFGEPFILALNKETGVQKYFTKVEKKGNWILDYIVKENAMVIVLKDKILRYSEKNGTLLNVKSFEDKEFENLRFFADNSIYKKNKDSILSNIELLDSTKIFVQTSQGKIVEFDKGFNITNQYDFNQFYFHFFDINNYKFFENKNKFIIQDENNKPIAELNFPGDYYLIGNKLYETDAESLLEIDLNDVLPDL